MSTRMFELRDFGQRKRAVTLARGNVNDLITIYDSIKVKTITNPEDAEELRLKLKTLKKALETYEKCVLQQEEWVVNQRRECRIKEEAFDEKWDAEFTKILKGFRINLLIDFH